MVNTWVRGCVIGVSFILVACQQTKQYTLSEQMVNHSLQQMTSKSSNNFPVAKLIDVDFAFEQLDAEIGRTNSEQDIVLSSHAKTVINSLHGTDQVNVSLRFKALPNFNQTEGSVYLKEVQLLSYTLDSHQQGQMQSKALIPYINQALLFYFEQNPIYVLDKGDQRESLARANTTSLAIAKGELIFNLH